MKQKRNFITLGLMITSIILLVLLEGLWLFRSYEKELFDFRSQVSFLLREAVNELRDSVLLENVQRLPKDSISLRLKQSFPNDSIAAAITRIERHVQPASEGTSRENVRIFITAPSDSLDADILKPLVGRIGEPVGEKTHTTFVLRINNDTLDASVLLNRYVNFLRKQDLPSPERIHLLSDVRKDVAPGSIKRRRNVLRTQGSGENQQKIFSDGINTEAVSYSPLLKYHASFTGVRIYMLRQLAPEILFSFFLTLLTCGAFILVYGSVKRQQRLMDAKDTFISNITHELKTPVATVGVALEALKNFNAMGKPELMRDYLDIALRELNRLAAMTDNILKTSVLETSKSTKSEPVDLKSVVENVVSSMRVLASGCGATITAESEGANFVLQGNAESLSNALTNLIDNAIKYSEAVPRVHVALRAVEDAFTLSVKDDGPGIDPAFHEEIFEKFFRVPQGDVHTVKGYGLGLNYVRSVVRIHKGTIELKSSAKTGSEFILTFPKKSLHP